MNKKAKRGFDPDARLPYPTRMVEIQGDMVEEYLIPADKKAAVLELLYPFAPRPALDDEMLDIHEDQVFVVREFKVYREGNMNVLASPYYPVGGGTVIDWMPAENEYAGEEDEGYDEKMRGEPTTPAAVDPEFYRWPEKWADDPELWPDKKVDRVLCAEMFELLCPFAEHIAASGMAEGKLEHYIENLETLGLVMCTGGLTHEKFDQPSAAERLAAALGPQRGPEICYHPGGADADDSFHATCRKLYVFLKDGGNGK